MSTALKALNNWQQNKPKYISSEHIFFLSYIRSRTKGNPVRWEGLKHFNKDPQSLKIVAANVLKMLSDYRVGEHVSAATGKNSRLQTKFKTLLKDFGMTEQDFNRELEENLHNQCIKVIYQD